MCDINRDQNSVEMNKRSDQDRCRQTAKVIMSGFLHQKNIREHSFYNSNFALFKK